MFEIVNNITEIWDRFGKFALPICFLIILISFNWYIHKDTIVESLQKWSLVINIALIIAVIITSLFSYGLIDFTKKNLDDSSFLIVISPFQSFGSSENLKEYDFGTSQSIKRDLEGFANVSVEILDKNDGNNSLLGS